jgi:hypothetical protein
MWCDGLPQPPAVLPATLAVPWALVSHALGMPPVLTYATYNLLNWARLDAGGPAALGNIICLNVSRSLRACVHPGPCRMPACTCWRGGTRIASPSCFVG